MHTAAVTHTDITVDGNELISASLDKTIKFWNLSYGT